MKHNTLKSLFFSAIILTVQTAYADEPGHASEPAVNKSVTQEDAPGIESVTGERLATAKGYYARSRAMLIAAIREFDKGAKIANPDVILNTKEWRGDLIDRAKDLEKILDPQPRISRGGVKFDAYPELLNEAGR